MQQHIQSPYAPVRFQAMRWWGVAREAARAGLVSREGVINAGLMPFIIDELFQPTADSAHADSTLTLEQHGRIQAELASYAKWVPVAAQFESCGRQIFDLGDELVELLAHTDFGDTTLEPWNPPYNAFFVRFGKRTETKLLLGDGEPEYLDGAFISVMPNNAGGRDLTLGFTMVREDCTAAEAPRYSLSLNAEEQRMPVREGISHALARSKELVSAAADSNARNQSFYNAYEQQLSACSNMLQGAVELIINALFYLESVGAERAPRPGRDTPPDMEAQWAQASPEKRHKLRSRLTRDGYAVVYLMGQELIGEGRLSACGGKAPHWRRGHWRKQPHGVGREQIKRIWIKPVMIHSDLAPTDPPGHLYVTGAPPTAH